MTDFRPETFAGTREEIDAHLMALGHKPKAWKRIAQLPEDAEAALSAPGSGVSRGKSWCRHRHVTCEDGSPGVVSVCFTKNDDGTFEEWSSNTKAMWQSRRFYGLVLIMAGRLWMLKTGSNAFLGAVSDPLVMEFVGGFCVMIAGELVQSWGRRKATRALH